MRTGRNNKNGGFSLVELIIVVAIMAIVVGVIGLSVGTLTGRKIAKCADEIVSTLERARVLTLGKEQNQVEFVLTDVSGEFMRRSIREVRRYQTESLERILSQYKYILMMIPLPIICHD